MELKFSPVHFSLPFFLVTCFSNALARFQFCLKSLRTVAHQPRLFTAEFYGSNFYYNQYLEPFVTRSNSYTVAVATHAIIHMPVSFIGLHYNSVTCIPALNHMCG